MLYPVKTEGQQEAKIEKAEGMHPLQKTFMEEGMKAKLSSDFLYVYTLTHDNREEVIMGVDISFLPQPSPLDKGVMQQPIVIVSKLTELPGEEPSLDYWVPFELSLEKSPDGSYYLNPLQEFKSHPSLIFPIEVTDDVSGHTIIIHEDNAGELCLEFIPNPNQPEE